MHEVPYDPIADFEPITLIADAPSIIVVHRAVPATDLASFIAYVKRNPGIDYASAGTGTTTHLAGEALKLRAAIEMTHVPYKAVGQAVSDLLAGQIKMMIYQVPTLKPHVDSGALTLIAATTARRIASLPDLPTVAETYPGFDFSAWFGMLAPAGTPKPIVRKLHAALLAAMASASLEHQFVAQGLEPVGLGPDDFHALMLAALPKWKEIIDLTGTRMP
jgi:tripartite-type tricarboxylate transporter receptor subunit TctC